MECSTIVSSSLSALTLKTNTSTDNDINCDFLQYDDSVFNYINFGLLVFLIPCILFGNITVLASIIRFRKLHTCMNILIANLAIGDLLVGFPTSPLYALIYIHTDIGRSKWLCLVKTTSVIASFSCTLLTLAAISVERYVALFHPLHYNFWLTKKRVKLAIAAIWCYVIPVSVAPLFGINTWNQFHSCEYFDLLPKALTITAFVVTLGISFPMSAVLFTIITCKIRTVQKRVMIIKFNQHNKWSRTDKEKTAGIMMAFMFLLFVVFWSPFAVVIPLKYVSEDRNLIENIKNLTLVIAMANSAVNPIVYCWCKEELRMAMCSTVWCKIIQQRTQIKRQRRVIQKDPQESAENVFSVL